MLDFINLIHSSISTKIQILFTWLAFSMNIHPWHIRFFYTFNFSISFAAAAAASTSRARSKFSDILPPIILLPIVRFADPPKPPTWSVLVRVAYNTTAYIALIIEKWKKKMKWSVSEFFYQNKMIFIYLLTPSFESSNGNAAPIPCRQLWLRLR